MATFALTEAQQQLETSVRRFARTELLPHANARAHAHEIPSQVMAAVAAQGLIGVNVPEAYGGAEAGVVAYATAVRELAYADPAVAVTMAVTNMVAELLARYGSEPHHAHLRALCAGDYFAGAFALSEAGAGSDPGSITTRAVRDGTDWILNGEKLWISHGDRAGVLIVWARTGGTGAHGLSCFVVDNGLPGLVAGPPEDKMGLWASHTVPLSFHDVRLPGHALLGQEGQGFALAMRALDGGRIGVASQAIGIGARALDVAIAHTQTRRQFGKPLSEFEATQFKLCDMATALDAGWLLTLRAAWLKEKAQPFSRQAAMAKVSASEACNRVVRDAVQLLGGTGYFEDAEVARLYRDARVTQIYEGTSEIQRLVIGRDLLKEGL